MLLASKIKVYHQVFFKIKRILKSQKVKEYIVLNNESKEALVERLTTKQVAAEVSTTSPERDEETPLLVDEA